MDLSSIGAGAFAFSEIGSEPMEEPKVVSKSVPEVAKSTTIIDEDAAPSVTNKPERANEMPDIKAHELADNSVKSRGLVANFLDSLNKSYPNPYIEATVTLLRKDIAKWERACAKLDAETVKRRVDCKDGILRMLREMDYELLKSMGRNVPTVLEARKGEDKKARMAEAKVYTKAKIAELRAIGVPAAQLEQIERQMIEAVMNRQGSAPLAVGCSDEPEKVVTTSLDKLGVWARLSEYKEGVKLKAIFPAKYKVMYEGQEYYWQGKGRQPMPVQLHLAKGGKLNELLNVTNHPPMYSATSQSSYMSREGINERIKEEMEALSNG